MSNANQFSMVDEISKQQVEAAVAFAIDYVPGVDIWTLQKFLEYVTVTESDSLVSKGELLEKMRLIRKHLPKSCRYSLLMMAELLELAPPAQATEDKPAVTTRLRPFRLQPNFKTAPTFSN